MTSLTRRGVVAAGLALGAGSGMAAAQPAAGGLALAADETYWAGIAAQYDLADDFIQLENGNWGIMARPVLTAYERHQAMVNRRNSYYSRREYGADLTRVRARVAANLGVAPEEIAFTRGATEALQALISGYNRLKPGDQVLIADLDYDSMQSAMAWLKDRRAAELVRIELPEPATRLGLIDAYAAALDANPKVRLMLLTQVSHRNGLHLPVAEITALARARGVDVILDSAHAWGQVETKLPELGADRRGRALYRQGPYPGHRSLHGDRRSPSRRRASEGPYRHLQHGGLSGHGRRARLSRGHRNVGQGCAADLSAASLDRTPAGRSGRAAPDAGR